MGQQRQFTAQGTGHWPAIVMPSALLTASAADNGAVPARAAVGPSGC